MGFLAQMVAAFFLELAKRLAERAARLGDRLRKAGARVRARRRA